MKLRYVGAAGKLQAVESCVTISAQTQVNHCMSGQRREYRKYYCSHNNNLDLLFDFPDETGILEKLKQRYETEALTDEADLKIVFTDLIRSLCEYEQSSNHRSLTKIDGYQHLTNMLLVGQFQSRNFYEICKALYLFLNC